MIEITDSNFEDVVSSQIPVFIDCFAEWCGPCKLLKPLLEELEAENSGKMTLGILNVENNPQVALKLNITAVPRVVVYRDGKEVASIIGVRPKQDYQQFLDELED